MKVTVRSIVRLAAQVPAGRHGNCIELEVGPAATPADLIARLGLSAERSYLVMVNGEIVPEARQDVARLRDNDEVTILPKPKVG